MNLVIISHCSESLDWVSKLTIPFIIYSRTLPTENMIVHIPHNVGRESYIYTKYIAEHYDNLPDRCVFIHGHETAYHQSGSTQDLINQINWAQEYCSINNLIGITSLRDGDNWKECGFAISGSVLRKHWEQLFSSYVTLPETLLLHHTKSAQFMVSRERIRMYPRKMYFDINEWLLTTTIDHELDVGGPRPYFTSYISGRLLEWSWDYLYDKKAHPKVRLDA